LLSIVISMGGHLEDGEIFFQFQNFLIKENKSYSTIEEFNARYKIFKSNHQQIFSNKLGNEKTFTSGITKFMDLTPEEFKETYLGYKVSVIQKLDHLSSPKAEYKNTAPDTHDWREHGAVGPVKDQGQCGSCWAFSTVANLEGQNFIHHGKMIQFSEQQLVSCDTNDNGCGGGYMSTAFDYIKTFGGLELQSDYPYASGSGDSGTCSSDVTKAAITVVGKTLISTDETDIKNALYSLGPISVAINASSSLQFYSKGIIDLDSTKCSPEALDHAVIIVGYGTENGLDFWIVKNSWGNWGEDGYFRMSRGKGTCGINTNAICATIG